MKIRIKGNAVRFRLSKSEVELFAEKGYVEEQTDFITSSFVYAVRSTPKNALSATFTNNHLTVFVPQNTLQHWASTNTVGFDYNIPLPGGKSLYILIEKDFKCIDADINEDQSDYFENPVKAC